MEYLQQTAETQPILRLSLLICDLDVNEMKFCKRQKAEKSRSKILIEAQNEIKENDRKLQRKGITK